MSRTLTVKIPRPLAARLSARVRKRQTTQSAVVREALERYLQDGFDGPDSFLSLASDLVGSISGPVDLSSNRKHLRGFGR
jgi:hypothetical protein